MEPSWEELAATVDKIRESGRILQALWSAYEGREEYGNWFFVPGEDGAERALADFGLFAANAIAKLGVAPAPIPTASEHDPQWKRQCEILQETSRLRGKEKDFSNAVPYGLGNLDRDAVDPCTRAWLEVLRKTGQFREAINWESLDGEPRKEFYIRIVDVYGASATYCQQRARDEIGRSLLPDARSYESFVPDLELRDQLIEFWQAFRADDARWERGMREEKEPSLPFPPRLVAYELIPFFGHWARRVLPAPASPVLVSRLIAEICPDERYANWAESDSVNRLERYTRANGKLSLKEAASPLLFGTWENVVQQSWDSAKSRMGKYESCASCREYDSHEWRSPATLALRLPGSRRPVRDDLKRQIDGILADIVGRKLPQASPMNETNTDVDIPKVLLDIELIKAWMNEEGYTNETLATRLKLSERAISSIRNNGDYHGSDAVIKLANLMGRNPEDLYIPPEAST